MVLASTLMPLPTLESQRDWNAQRDPLKASQIYSVGFMAIHYLVTTYGEQSVGTLIQ